MDRVTGAIASRMIEDSELIGRLNSFKGEPCVFSYFPVETKADPPFIVIEPLTDIPFDSKNGCFGRDIQKRISCWILPSGTFSKVEQIMELIRKLFHRHLLEIEGYRTVIANVENIGLDNSDVRYVGMSLELRLVIQEK